MIDDMLSRLLADDEASVTTESRGSEGQVPDGPEGAGADDRVAEDGRSIGGVDQAAGPDLDAVFDLLRNRRRRDVLQCVRAASGPVDIGTLAIRIAARECGKEPDEVTSTERKRVYISLYQCHLSKMDELDAVEYDERSGTVEAGADYEVFICHLPGEPPFTETGPRP